jgi:uncharacterized protein (TIGR02145 family)
MKKTHFIASITLVISNICISQSVTIGTQTWMTKNLSVSNFRNGDPIPEVKGNADWLKAGKERKPAWCYFHNDSSEGAIYGKLYNGWAVYDPRGLAPEGWHIPSMGEWDTLIYFLSRGYGKDRALLKMKTKSESDWPSYRYGDAGDWNRTIGNNSSGFSLIPNPYRDGNSRFLGWQQTVDQTIVMQSAYIWSSSITHRQFSSAFPVTSDSRWSPLIFSTAGDSEFRITSQDFGLVVRCVHD